MVHPCAQCGAAPPPGPEAMRARFCGSCGAPTPEPPEQASAVARYRGVLEKFLGEAMVPDPLGGAELEQLAALRQRLTVSLPTHERLVAEWAQARPRAAAAAGAETARIRLFIDTQTLRHFAVGTRCVIRLKVENGGALALDPVAIHAEVVGGQRPAPAHSAAVFPGHSGVLPIWLVPTMPGFFELAGVVYVVDLAGVASYFRFSAVQFRVGDSGEGARVSVVNIDQSAARVVDNSRSQFARGLPEDDRGGLVGDGEFHPVALRPVAATEAVALCPGLAATLPVAVATPANPQSAPATPRVRPGASVRFTIPKILHNGLHADTYSACRPHQNSHRIRSGKYTGASDGGSEP